MKLIGKRPLAAVAALASLFIAGSAASASASTPVIYASTFNGYAQVHKCTVIGTDYFGNQGVVCVELYANGTGPSAAGDMVVFCQDSGRKKVPCAQIDAYGAFANAVNGVGARIEGHCGHAYGPCDPDHNFWGLGLHDIGDTSTGCTTDLVDNYWSVVYGQGALASLFRGLVVGSGPVVFVC